MSRTGHITEVMKRYESPFYFYDLDQFEAHIKSIKKTLHPDIKIWYATKANPLLEILKILNHNGFGIDVASLGELKQAQMAGFSNDNLIATGPAKSKTYLRALMEASVHTVVIESINQLRDLNKIAGELGRTQNVLLRVQLDWDEGLKSVLGGSSITPFGLGISDWKEIKISDYKNLNILGLHCFQWGNVLDMKQLESVWKLTIEGCMRLASSLDLELKILDLGGGLGVSYTNSQEMIFSEVHDLLLKLKTEYQLKDIWLELGRFSIAKFGSYLTKIVDIKSVRGKNIIVTEGGINHLARPSLVGESFPCEGFMNQCQSLVEYTVHGPLCTALDNLGTFALPKDLKVDDWLEFKLAGAYGFTESMPYFLCHSLAGEAASYQGELLIPRPPKKDLDWMV